jgi:hypothetical protein
MGLYAAANLDKDACRDRINEASSFDEKRNVKREIARRLASPLTVESLDDIPEIKRAAELALAPSLDGQEEG